MEFDLTEPTKQILGERCRKGSRVICIFEEVQSLDNQNVGSSWRFGWWHNLMNFVITTRWPS